MFRVTEFHITLTDFLSNSSYLNTLDSLYRFDEKFMPTTRYIDTILARIPLNPLYLMENKSLTSNYELLNDHRVLDSVIALIKYNAKLHDMLFFPEYNQFTFMDLPRHIQRRIAETQLNVIELRNLDENVTESGAKMQLIIQSLYND